MLRRYFTAGLLVWLPILVTFYVINFLVKLINNSLNLFLDLYRPEFLNDLHIPGLGILLTLAIVCLSGVLATNFLGKRLLAIGEKILARIPFIRSIYSAAKRVLETLLTSSGQAFQKVLLVEYPRSGIWTLGFQTNTGLNHHAFEENGSTDEEKLLTVFIPTTPTPTSGFLVMVRANEVKELNLSVDEALKVVLSLGMLTPKRSKQ